MAPRAWILANVALDRVAVACSGSASAFGCLAGCFFSALSTVAHFGKVADFSLDVKSNALAAFRVAMVCSASETVVP